jgi:ElaB/YqjD/DUF883 family membrane-anchored ribosome-binding protein
METPNIVPAGSNGANGSWESKVDHAKSGVHNTIDKVSDAARPAVDNLSASAHATVDKLSNSLTQAATVLSEKLGQLKEVQENIIADARVRVRDKPVTALAIAVAAGFLIRHLLRLR